MHPLPVPRWFPALALLAIALLVLAPLISRALGSSHHEAPATSMTASGLPAVPGEAAHAHAPRDHHAAHVMGHGHDVAPHPVEHAAPLTAADPHASHEMGVDCDYCLIAARMMGLLVALLLVLVAWSAVVHRGPALQRALRAIVPGTLGARGPPHALAR